MGWARELTAGGRVGARSIGAQVCKSAVEFSAGGERSRCPMVSWASDMSSIPIPSDCGIVGYQDRAEGRGASDRKAARLTCARVQKKGQENK